MFKEIVGIVGKMAGFSGAALILLATAATIVTAAPPHPSLKASIEAGETEPPPFLRDSHLNHLRGVCSADEDQPLAKAVRLARAAQNAYQQGSPSAAAATFRVLAVLVDFSDKASSVSSNFFDTLLFVSQSGTVRDYYSEISYGQLDIVSLNLPSSLGWKRAPQTYAYYTDGQNGTGSYPQNSQKLTEDIVDLIDPLVDFSQYDNDGNGSVDVLIIVHTGPGAEFTGSANDIWSHKWSISPRSKDGVTISDYTIQPEYWSSPGDMTIGVYAHELGHGFGLPDLYDTDNSSWGLGRWSLMASGSWNGPSSMGDSPAHPDPWSRISMGLATATNVTSNTVGSSIPSVESGSNIFRLWTAGGGGNEYFLVENRQKTGYDSYLPGSGLLIWHIDESKSGNTNEWYPGNIGSGNYLVSLEQSDGLWNMEKKIDVGSVADPFSSNNGSTSFSPISTPNSNSYSGGTTFVGVTNISASGATMTADFSVSLAAGFEDGEVEPALPGSVALHQNFPNPFNPTTTISFDLPKSALVTVTVFNLLGQTVTILANGYFTSGNHEVVWDGRDENGSTVASGVYFYELVTGETREARSMGLVK